MHPAHSDSSAAKWFPVASPSNPPKVIIGDREAKYKNVIDAILWTAKASVKSDLYLEKQNLFGDIEYITRGHAGLASWPDIYFKIYRQHTKVLCA